MFMQRTLGEICDEVGGIIQTGPFGSQLHESDYVAEGTPMIMPKNISDGRILLDGIAYIRDEDVARLAKHKLSAGDIVYGRRGDIGRHALITEREQGWLCGTGSLRISLGNSVLDPMFLHYYLTMPQVIKWISNQAIGATLPNLNTSIIRSIRIVYPPLPIQRKIAGILSAYDDLIENNTRRIRILEDMARALYREWFVHFRFPGAASYEMVESELGPIPEGCQVVQLRDCVELSRSGINPATYGTEDFAHYSIPAYDDGRLPVIEPGANIRSGKFLISENAVLVSKINPRIPRVWLPYLTHAERAVASTEFLVLVPRASTRLEFVYGMCQMPEFLSELAARAGGTSTSHQRVKPDDFLNLPVIVPESAMAERFVEIAAPMFHSIHNLRLRNATLRHTRDLLLPKLVSGEVDVEEVEREAAASGMTASGMTASGMTASGMTASG